jgi:hypothetical protein
VRRQVAKVERAWLNFARAAVLERRAGDVVERTLAWVEGEARRVAEVVVDREFAGVAGVVAEGDEAEVAVEPQADRARAARARRMHARRVAEGELKGKRQRAECSTVE